MYIWGVLPQRHLGIDIRFGHYSHISPRHRIYHSWTSLRIDSCHLRMPMSPRPSRLSSHSSMTPDIDSYIWWWLCRHRVACCLEIIPWWLLLRFCMCLSRAVCFTNTTLRTVKVSMCSGPFLTSNPSQDCPCMWIHQHILSKHLPLVSRFRTSLLSVSHQRMRVPLTLILLPGCNALWRWRIYWGIDRCHSRAWALWLGRQVPHNSTCNAHIVTSIWWPFLGSVCPK